MSEPNFFRQPGWKRRNDLLSRLWSLSLVCRTQAATPEHGITTNEMVEIQQFKTETVRTLRDLADQLDQVGVGLDEQSLIKSANEFRAVIDYVNAPEVQGEPVSGYG